MRIALTRAVGPRIAECELTHLARLPIDAARAAAQHAAYERALVELGCTLQRLPALPDHPDAVFVEDTAVVLDGLAIVARPGAAARRAEVHTAAAALAAYRPIASIEPPGTLDGGDVLRVGRRLYVARSTRTNDDGIAQLRRLAQADDYEVYTVELTGCLHLKTAITAVAADALLANPAWVDTRAFGDADIIRVDPAEPFAANGLCVGETVIFSDAYPRTAERLADRGIELRLVDNSELAKAEGGVTCCSVLVDA